MWVRKGGREGVGEEGRKRGIVGEGTAREEVLIWVWVWVRFLPLVVTVIFFSQLFFNVFHVTFTCTSDPVFFLK